METNVELFIRLIQAYAASHNRQRPTVEDMQEMLRREGYKFTRREIKEYGRQALEKMIVRR